MHGQREDLPGCPAGAGIGSTRTVPPERHARPARRRPSDERTTPAGQRGGLPRYCAQEAHDRAVQALAHGSVDDAGAFEDAAVLVAGSAISSSADST